MARDRPLCTPIDAALDAHDPAAAEEAIANAFLDGAVDTQSPDVARVLGRMADAVELVRTRR